MTTRPPDELTPREAGAEPPATLADAARSARRYYDHVAGGARYIKTKAVSGKAGVYSSPVMSSNYGAKFQDILDGTANVASGIFTLGTLVSGETLTLTGTGTVANKNVGTAKAVTLSKVSSASSRLACASWPLPTWIFAAPEGSRASG